MKALRRALVWWSLLALTLACGTSSSDDEPPPVPVTGPGPAPSPVAAPQPPPVLSPQVTGAQSSDPNVTIDRCTRTGWSYTGCSTTFPTQGRQYVAWACEHGPAQDRMILCARWAQYRLVGVGGPVERGPALTLLEQQCNQDHRISCVDLAEHTMFDDLTRARAAAARGCDVDPQNSPAGACDSLRQVLADGAIRRTATVLIATGLPGVATGGQCRTWVTTGASTCQGYVECGPHVLWGRGGSYFPCETDGANVSGGEDMATGDDGDGAFHIDTAARTLEVHDDASGPLGAFELRARLDEG